MEYQEEPKPINATEVVAIIGNTSATGSDLSNSTNLEDLAPSLVRIPRF
jgi:hypothetical protein